MSGRWLGVPGVLRPGGRRGGQRGGQRALADPARLTGRAVAGTRRGGHKRRFGLHLLRCDIFSANINKLQNLLRRHFRMNGKHYQNTDVTDRALGPGFLLAIH